MGNIDQSDVAALARHKSDIALHSDIVSPRQGLRIVNESRQPHGPRGPDGFWAAGVEAEGDEQDCPESHFRIQASEPIETCAPRAQWTGLPQQRLYLRFEPQGQGSLRPTFSLRTGSGTGGGAGGISFRRDSG